MAIIRDYYSTQKRRSRSEILSSLPRDSRYNTSGVNRYALYYTQSPAVADAAYARSEFNRILDAAMSGKIDMPKWEQLSPDVRRFVSKYQLVIDDGSGSSSSSSRSGGGSRRSGGGSGTARPPLNLRVYRPSAFSDARARQQAKVLADSWLRENLRSIERQRGDVHSKFADFVTRLYESRRQNELRNAEQREEAMARNANVALNRGMGYGSGYLTTQSNTAAQFQNALNELIRQYEVERSAAERDVMRSLYELGEEERLARAQRGAQFLQFLNELLGGEFQRYLGREQLRQSEIDSINRALMARKGVY